MIRLLGEWLLLSKQFGQSTSPGSEPGLYVLLLVQRRWCDMRPRLRGDGFSPIAMTSLFWASMPLVHVSGNAPPPGDDFELVTVYGTYSQGDIVVDRWERAR